MHPERSFLYERRFPNHSGRQKLDVLIERMKASVLRGLAASLFRNKLHPVDLYEIKRDRFREIYKFDEKPATRYNDIALTTVKFFEAVEIDDFDKSISIIVNKFRDQGPWRSDLQKASLKKSLSEVKTSMDSVSYGGEICHLQFYNNQKDDLMEYASISYIKTLESYFILTIEVKPSKKFEEVFKQIIVSEDMGLDTLRFNSISKILKGRIFVSHVEGGKSTMWSSLSNLVKDLNYQVKLNITNRLNGLFNKSSLPRIESYEVGSMEEFQKDEKLARLIGNPAEAFSLDDNKIHVIASTYYRKERRRLRVIKERGHGKREPSKSDLTNYDWVETHYLLQSLSLPCALEAIFIQQRDEFNTLKRRVYDYIKDSSRNGIWKQLNFVGYSRQYVGLKISLARGILLFRRFEDEFSTGNLKVFSRDPNLDIFKSKTTDARMAAKEKDLQLHFENFFSTQIKDLSKNIETLQQVFKPIEDLSIYRTNFWLQIVSISIGLLAIILTLDRAGEAVARFFFWLQDLFSM